MNQFVDQTEINNVLWKACDTFRGTIDASEYKNYLLVMLFVKYISDAYSEHFEQLQSEYAGDTERIKRRLERDRFVLPDNSSFTALYKQRNNDDIGQIINMALTAIEENNKNKLTGVFRNIDFNSESHLGQTRERNRKLKLLLEDFNNPILDLRPSRIGNQDIIGNAYEYLIANFASGAGKKAGEFYTPAEVSELIARLVEPQPNERIYDPTCGSGSLLIKCATQIQNLGSSNFSIYGQEVNGSTWALAKMNMFLHNIDEAKIAWGDTIREPKHLENNRLMKYEVVVANPPFSLDKWGAEDVTTDQYERFTRGIPPKSKGDYAFILHMIESSTEIRGRVGVVVPHGVLFRASSEGNIRQKLIEENLLDTVIGLPTNLFFGTGIPAAILLFKREKTDRNVFFIDASRDYQEGKNQNKLRETDLQKIISTAQARIPQDKYAALVPLETIAANDYNLNIPRYVDTFEAETEIDIKNIQNQIESLETTWQTQRQQMKKYLEELGLV
jgi:type I restriction enzyme M protein